MQKSSFLPQLQHHVNDLLVTLTTELEPSTTAALQYKPTATAWSALECLEHLNRYSRHYNPALQQALATAPLQPASSAIEFSWLGRKSYEMVRPENRKQQTTLKRLNPNQSTLDRAVLAEFRQHQLTLRHLLEQAAALDLNRRAVPVEFFKWLKLRTGEAFLFVVAHQQRHVQQAQRALQQAGAAVCAPVPHPVLG